MSENKSIISPVPGIFYRKPSPDKEVFVNEGDSVKAGDVIGLIEVMKNFYEIKAEADGIVERFCVENEDIVDAGQEVAVMK
ncbi:acetyl-CoA carboxylase [Aneurinibacillus aneurinilyticus]|uniref:Biotin carboxyl carrier protein of acetyl-CoA carboxylase n=2 Tax=Aneurinibacillus aneurinilyticus TaxID=1391 RepID=A0A848CT19_ANEAE|nr:acetyl-CoA carboxylase [Aneurinibacillus aneurinilyticus]ERI11433.1 Biotin-requiring enzyme [Aneurinibacillus aneurinilyticus ATCC 12856]MCI1694240.1 acetyl-CoA carboxylase [Aneurinibacillus aneurinilyticus]MED0671350.1 acetyl-CoA carboxylase [Aneurinibacillus aneurinilyticus]MED0707774.1 acetyl-CoA carboxylase [Aneurinibacillus aneurinilyticus]MED0722439.1 acetyl-CoA carboxylase [Aneurinibacillus aneurinilyticus]